MAALVGKGFVIFAGFFSHGSAATALNLKCYFDVAAFVSPGFRRVFLLRNYLFLFALKRLYRFDTSIAVSAMWRARTSCWTGRNRERERKREGGMPQLLISSVSGSFSQPKACRAGGG